MCTQQKCGSVGGWSSRWPVPVLLAAVIAAYANSLDGPFIFDDLDSIPENPHVVGLWPLREAMSAPPQTTAAGRPIVCLSLACNYALGELNVRGYHVFNVAAHFLSALVLFGIIRRTLLFPVFVGRYEPAGSWGAAVQEGPRPGAPGKPAALRCRITANDFLALISAVIWAVHPLQTEAVDYIIQRTELLMGLFYLLTLYCAIRGWQGGRHWIWFSTAVAACALGMGCKEVMASAPLMVLLYDRLFVSESFRACLRRHAGLYAGLAATWGLLAWLILSGPRNESVGFALGISAREYLRTQAGVILWYLRLSVWPHPLVISCDGWPVARGWTEVLPQGLAVLVLLAGTAWAVWRRHPLGFPGAWFFLILAPTSSFVPIASELAAERRMHLPLAAVVVCVVIGGYHLIRILSTRPGAPKQLISAVGAALAVVVTLALGATTATRNRDYRSEEAIWADAVKKRPDNPQAWYCLGDAVFKQGRVEEAIRLYREALQLKPHYAEAHNNLGNRLAEQGSLDEAIEHYQEAVRFQCVDAYINLGNALARQGQVDEAMAQYHQAIHLKPEWPEPYYNLAAALVGKGCLEEAVVRYREALERKPHFAAAAHASLAKVLVELGRLDEAIQHYRKAVELKPDFQPFRDELDEAVQRRDAGAGAAATGG